MFIDANIFLEIILKDQNSADCKEYFLNKRHNYMFTPDFVIYICIIQIQKKLNSKSSMKELLKTIHTLNIVILRTNMYEIYRSIQISEKENLDFDDPLIVSIMRKNKIQELISYDKHFDGIKDIKRIEP